MMDDLIEDVALVFREQADGRKVSRLPGGKVVLVEVESLDTIKDSERWLVRLRHRDTFAIAHPLEKLASLPVEPKPEPAPAQTTSPGASTARTVTVRADEGDAKPRPAREPIVPKPALIGGMLVEPSDIIRARERVALFVDGANMDGACRDAGYFLDYRKVRDYFLGNGDFYAGFYYIADFTREREDQLQVRFQDFLSYSGYIVRKKPVKVQVDDETGERTFKANVDTEIVLDMLNTIANYDVAVLFSGDSDFERCVDLLRSRGKRVYVVSSRGTLSRELAHIADKPVFFIEDFKTVIGREDR